MNVFVVVWHDYNEPNCDVYATREKLLDDYGSEIAPNLLDLAEQNPGESVEGTPGASMGAFTLRFVEVRGFESEPYDHSRAKEDRRNEGLQ